MKNELTTIRRIFLLLMAAMMLCMTSVPIYAQSVVAGDIVADTIIGGEDELMPMAANGCITSAGQMQIQVERGKAPSCVVRVDGADVRLGIQAHVHFSDGSAINIDGTPHHGSPNINNATKEWLQSNGWCMGL